MMNQSQPSTLSTDKQTGGVPQPIWQHNTNIGQTGIEANYGSTHEAPPLSWFKDTQKNKPQSNSMTAASLIMLSGGMGWASSIGFGPYIIGTHIQVCWFIGVIIGACISAALVHRIPKRMFDIAASVLVLIKGIIFIVASTYSSIAIVFARYCDGISFGLILIPAILAGSEQSVKRFRGVVLSIEQTSLVSGAFITIAFMNFAAYPNQWYGICAVIFGLVALVATFFFTIESPIFWLRKDNENEAVIVLSRLQRPKTVTNETYALLNENKALLEEDLHRGIPMNISNSWIPMAKMILHRCFVSMSSFYPMTVVFFTAVVLNEYPSIYTFNYFYYIYMFMRLFGDMFSIFCLDSIGRRIPSAIALLAGGVILIIIAILDLSFFNRHNAITVIYLLIVYQLVSGFMAPASTCYLSEAFSLSVKPYFILAVIFSENILQIITCCALDKLTISTFCYTLGAMQIVYGIVFYFIMPETKQTTLRNALKMFQPIFAGKV